MENTLDSAFAKVVYSQQLKKYGKERVALGIGNYQGKRLVIQIIIYASEIPILFRNISRPIIESHSLEIEDYILKRVCADKKWILGALTANVDPDLIKYDKIGSNLYLVSIPNGTFLRITDGQHRISAIARLMNSQHREFIANEQIPCSLILEKSSRQTDVDFQDMAKTKTMPSSLMAAFASEGKDAIAIEVMNRVNFLSIATRIDSASPGSGSKYIYTLNYISNLVSCAINGDRAATLRDRNAPLAEYDSEEKIEGVGIELSEILNEFFNSCPITSNLSQKEELSAEEVKIFRSSYILGLSMGLEILGCLIYQLRQKNISIEQVATQISWSRNNKLWDEIFPRQKATTNDETLGVLKVNDAFQKLMKLERQGY